MCLQNIFFSGAVTEAMTCKSKLYCAGWRYFTFLSLAVLPEWPPNVKKKHRTTLFLSLGGSIVTVRPNILYHIGCLPFNLK